MISERTGRLVYTYDPETGATVEDGNAIRDIASIRDVELLSRFLHRPALLPLIDRSLRHYEGFLVARDGAVILDPARLEEPSGISHSAFLLLRAARLRASRRVRRRSSRSRRGSSSSSGRTGRSGATSTTRPTQGLEFYPGEAMLALMEAYAAGGDVSLPGRGRARLRVPPSHFPPWAISPDLRVFHANWQSQYGDRLHASTGTHELRTAVRDYVFALHDRVIESQFYDDLVWHPTRQATVEVACALEGLNDAYTIALRESDFGHIRVYERCLRNALKWLFLAQRVDDCTSRERGGFGHSLVSRMQRIDVTGHVLGGFIKSVRNRLGA